MAKKTKVAVTGTISPELAQRLEAQRPGSGGFLNDEEADYSLNDDPLDQDDEDDGFRSPSNGSAGRLTGSVGRLTSIGAADDTPR